MNDKTNQLATGNISKLLLEYSIPAIIAQIASTLYNVIDSIFIGRYIGAFALSGVGITLPLMNLATAFGALVGVGGSAITSIKLGQKDYQGANQVLGNVIFLNIILGLIIMIFGLVYIDPILMIFGASPSTLPYARDFMMVILFGNVITHMYFGLVSVMRSAGFPQKSMRITLLAVLVNVCLAPLFIIVFKWGVKGAAFATVLAQLTSLIYLIVHFSKKDQLIRIYKKYIYPNSQTIKAIISIGMSPFMMHICSCLISILINNKLAEHGGDYAIGAFSVINRILMIFVMLVLGFNQGMQPIAGYNFGAKLYSRVNQVLKITIMYATGCMIIGFLAGEFFSYQICSIFNDEKELMDIAAQGMKIVMLTFPIVGFQMVTSNFFQSINKAKIAVLLSTSRQLLFLLPCILILPDIYGLNGVWYCMPASDFLAAIFALIMLIRQYKKFNNQ